MAIIKEAEIKFQALEHVGTKMMIATVQL